MQKTINFTGTNQVIMKHAFYKHLSLFLALTIGTQAVYAHTEDGIGSSMKPKLQQPATLSFKENKGQVVDQHGNPRSDIQYKLDGNGINIFAGNGQIHYQWRKPSGENKEEIYRLDVTLVGANIHASSVATDQQTYSEYYYLNGSTDASLVKTFNKVTYKDIYPNIDWVLYTKDNQLKYDFIVHSGGNIQDIKLRYDGATSLTLKDGSLIAQTPFGNIIEQKPYSYDAETKQEVPSEFVLMNNTLVFGVGAHKGNIVIDPALLWSTYYGGSGSDDGRAVATDAAGNAILAGQTSSTTNIATGGAFKTFLSGVGSNGYLVKFNNLGQRQWGTYYGTAQTAFDAVHIDQSGNVYAAGYTDNTSAIATGGSHQTFMAGVRDAILVKFSSTGLRQWATYYGGTGYDNALALDIDPSGNVYMGGTTFSTTGIATVGAHQVALTSANGSWEDGFLVKFNSSGVRQWATYYGGDTIDYIKALAVDASGNIFIGGQTYSASGISTSGSHQVGRGSTTAADGFLAMFNTSGVRQWGTYYGGTNAEIINGVAVDISGFVYFTGTTNSTGSIATSGVQQTGLFGGTDAMVAKFNSSGVRQWGSYLGWTGNEEGQSIGVNSAGIIYFAGTTNSTTNISTAGNFQVALGGGVDNYIEKFSTTGFRQEGTYFGGTGTENACAFAYSDAGILYLGGWTGSSAGIASVGSHQSTFGGGLNDGYLAAFTVTDTVINLALPFNDTIKCAGDNMSVTYGVTSTFRPGNVFSVQLSNAAGSFAAPVTIGSITSSIGGTIACTIPLGTLSGNGYRIRVVSSLPVRNSADNGKDIRIGIKPVALNATSNTPLCTGKALNLNVTTSTSPVTFSWTGPGGFSSTLQNPTVTPLTLISSGNYIVTATNNLCSSKDTVTVVVNTSPALPALTVNQPCEGDTLKLTASGSATNTYLWWGPNSFTSGAQNPNIPNVTTAASGTYRVKTTATSGCASDTANIVATVQAAPAKPVASNSSPVCSGNTLNLYATTTTSGVTYTWSGPNGFISSQQNPSITNVDTLATGSYVVTASIGACNRTDTTIATVLYTHTPSLSITSNPANPSAGESVTFSAVMTGCYTTPVYLWKKNGYFVLGVTGDTWTVTLADKDTINGVGVCNDPCAIPQTVSSNYIPVGPVGIGNVAGNLNIGLYPNPNNGNFTVSGNIGSEKTVIIEVLNTVGQVVYQDQVTAVNGNINTQVSVNNTPNGVYMLRVRGKESSKLIRFTLNR